MSGCCQTKVRLSDLMNASRMQGYVNLVQFPLPTFPLGVIIISIESSWKTHNCSSYAYCAQVPLTVRVLRRNSLGSIPINPLEFWLICEIITKLWKSNNFKMAKNKLDNTQEVDTKKSIRTSLSVCSDHLRPEIFVELPDRLKTMRTIYKWWILEEKHQYNRLARNHRRPVKLIIFFSPD